MSCGVGHRLGSDLAFLWLWCRPVTTAPTQPLALELPYAVNVDLEKQKDKKKKKKKANIMSVIVEIVDSTARLPGFHCLLLCLPPCKRPLISVSICQFPQL